MLKASDIIDNLTNDMNFEQLNDIALKLNDLVKTDNISLSDTINKINDKSIKKFPFKTLNKGLSKKLIINKGFPPNVGTSINVLSKRLLLANEVFDVININIESAYNFKVSDKEIIIDHLIDTQHVINLKRAVKSLHQIRKIYLDSLKKINGKHYDTVYTRTCDLGTRILSLMYKMDNPDVNYISELSDPIRRTACTNLHSNIENESEKLIKEINCYANKKYNLAPIMTDDLYLLAEYLVYVYSDSIIFTNENQMEYMINTFPIKGLEQIILSKSTVSNQPTLPKKYYSIKNVEYVMCNNKINIGYFGTFHKRRWLSSFFKTLSKLDNVHKNKFVIHVFSDKFTGKMLLSNLKPYRLEGIVKVNNSRSFLEFLNLCTKMDYLLLDDSVTKDILPLNPYLPSKASDYEGSGVPIWALYEPSSIISKRKYDIMTELNDEKAIARELVKLAEEKMKTNS